MNIYCKNEDNNKYIFKTPFNNKYNILTNTNFFDIYNTTFGLEYIKYLNKCKNVYFDFDDGIRFKDPCTNVNINNPNYSRLINISEYNTRGIFIKVKPKDSNHNYQYDKVIKNTADYVINNTDIAGNSLIYIFNHYGPQSFMNTNCYVIDFYTTSDTSDSSQSKRLYNSYQLVFEYNLTNNICPIYIIPNPDIITT